MNRSFFYIPITFLFFLSQKVTAQCDIPSPFEGNTGSNMSIIFTPAAVNDFPSYSSGAYIAVFSSDNTLFGTGLLDLIQSGSLVFPVWGDDTSTSDIDGLSTGEEMSFQLVDGNSLYDLNVSFAGLNSYSVNATLPAIGVSYNLNCQTSVFGCTDDQASNYSSEANSDDGSCEYTCSIPSPFEGNTGSNMSIIFTPAAVNDFPSYSYGAYIAVFSSDNTLFGTGFLDLIQSGSLVFPVWGDDTSTPDIDGLSTGEEMSFQLVDGNSLYDLNVSFAGLNSYSVNATLPAIGVSYNLNCVAPASGCLDTLACNFDAAANVDDGSCSYASSGYDCAGACLADADVDGVCDSFEVVGCQDNSACDYDSLATDSAACSYPAAEYDCAGACIADVDADGVCDAFEVVGCQDDAYADYDGLATDSGACSGLLGCTDSIYYEFNALATVDDSSCSVISVFGCMDNLAFNYNPSANIEDASCYLVVSGCMDTSAFNFNDYDGDGISNELTGVEGIDVNTDAANCIFYGCTDILAENFDSAANVNQFSNLNSSSPCEYILIPGCMDSLACNFDTLAQQDNGTCAIFDSCGVCGGTGAQENLDCDGNCLNDTDTDGICDENEVVGCQDSTAVNYDSSATDSDVCDYLGCTDSLYIEFDATATILDSSCQTLIVNGCLDSNYLEYDATANIDDGSCSVVIVYGCVDSLDINFNSFANVDDGSCFDLGCIDPNALNYNSEADFDDGSCDYPSVELPTDDSLQFCSIPSEWQGNTGSNMTVMLIPDVISILPDNLVEEAYIVAIANTSGLVVGSVSVFGVDQTAFPVWGNDSQTSETDGAVTDEIISYQLVNGNELYDLSFSFWLQGSTNFISQQINVGGNPSLVLNCTYFDVNSVVVGCMNPLACNFDSTANTPSSCFYPDYSLDCDGNCLNDSDNDGICNENEVVDCQDILAVNYNPNSTDNGICDYYGCTDSLYLEYDSLATISNGSCNVLIVEGCLNENADNFNSSANISDGLCTFNDISSPYIYVSFPEDGGSYLVGTELNITYEVFNSVIGFTSNPDADALIDCVINGDTLNPLFYGSGSIQYDFSIGSYQVEFFLKDNATDNFFNPLVVTTINFEVGPSGCTNSLSGNWNPSALIDDGSCVPDAGLDFINPLNTGTNHSLFIPEDVINPEEIDFQEGDLIGVFYLNNGSYVSGGYIEWNNSDALIAAFGDDLTTYFIDGFLPNQEFVWGVQFFETGNSVFLEPSFLSENSDNTFLNNGIYSVSSFSLVSGLAGCQDDTYLEFNSQAIFSDSDLCLTLIEEGCMNSSFAEYSSTANVDDGSCLNLIVQGCMDSLYLDFNQFANQDDGSCETLIIFGCLDSLALNYNATANTEIDNCQYDICLQVQVTNFVMQYSEEINDIVLSFDVLNLSENKIVYSPEFELNITSSPFDFGAIIYNDLPIYANSSVSVEVIITNENLGEDVDPNFELISGSIRLTSDSIFNGFSSNVDCNLDFNNELISTIHLGCTNSSSYNFDTLATINDGSCMESLSTLVVSNNPICSYEYGEAFVYVTGGIPPYSLSPSSYVSYSESGEPIDVLINFNEFGVAQFENLVGGEYPIQISDSVGVLFTDTIFIVIPPAIDAVAEYNSDYLLTSSSAIQPVFHQWLLDGLSIDGANNTYYYPQEVGMYQVYIEDEYGCYEYSDEVALPVVGLDEFNETSFSIYPNPAHETVTFSLNKLSNKTSISITDVLGQELNHVILDSKTSPLDYVIDVSDWPNGLYFIHVENNTNQFVNRFVKY